MFDIFCWLEASETALSQQIDLQVGPIIQARGNDFSSGGARFFPGVGIQEQKISGNIFSWAPFIYRYLRFLG